MIGFADMRIDKRSITLRPERRDYRKLRETPPELQDVLNVVNGAIWTNPELDNARTTVRQVLLQIVQYCDDVEAALAATGSSDQRIQRAIRRAINPDEPKKSLSELCEPVAGGYNFNFIVHLERDGPNPEIPAKQPADEV